MISFAAIGRFERRRPYLEWVEQHTHQSWNLPIRSLISLTDKGSFIFRYDSPQDKDSLLSFSPLPWTQKASSSSLVTRYGFFYLAFSSFNLDQAQMSTLSLLESAHPLLHSQLYWQPHYGR